MRQSKGPGVFLNLKLQENIWAPDYTFKETSWNCKELYREIPRPVAPVQFPCSKF